MAVLTRTFHIAVCDVCGAVFDEAGSERWHWDDTPELALAQVEYDPDLHWTLTANKQVVCPASNSAHYLMRGGESPVLLQPSRDAMTVTR